MNCLGKLGLIFTLIMLVLLGSCYKPYQYEQYVVIDGPPAGYICECIHEYPKYSAEENVVKVALIGESDGDAIYVQHGPYKVSFAAWRERLGSNAPIVSIESLSVQDQKGVESAVVFNNAPVVLTFKKHRASLEVAFVNFRKRLELQPKNGQRIYVTLVIKVDRGQSCTRTTLEYEFLPKVTKGWFRPWVI